MAAGQPRVAEIPNNMNPYYDHDGITIYHGSYADVIPYLPAVDAVVTDPPYGETSLAWDKRESGWVKRMAYVTHCMWVFGSFRMFMEMAAEQEFNSWTRAQEIVWEKHNGSNFHADRFRRVHELVVQFYLGDWADIYKDPQTTPDATARSVRRKKRPTHTGHIDAGFYESFDGGPRLMRSVLQVRSCHGYAQHPTQKPLGIVEPIIKYSVPPGGLVLDPFMGSGTTLVCAGMLGRKAVGVEVEEKYCEVAARRIEQEAGMFL